MAGAHCAYLNLSLPLPLKKPLLVCLSSLPANFKVRRRNHLREKLLKTLTKPYPNSIIPIEPSPNSIIPIKPSINQIIPVEPENLQQSEVKNVVENDGVISVIKGGFGEHWVLKLGLYMVGIFVFQIICTVLVFGSDDAVEKEAKDLVFEEKSKKRPSLLLNRNGYSGVSDVDERISEIQALAREVRESERLKSNVDEEDSDGVSRTGIEMEVNRRLVKLRKELPSSVKKMPGVAGRERGDLVGRDKFEPLMIKKKYKFKGNSGGLSDKPKGFGTKDSKFHESDDHKLASKDEKNVFDSVTQPIEKDRKIKQSKESSKMVQVSENKSGKESMQEKSRKSELSSRGETQEGSLRRLVGSNKSTSKAEDNQLKAKANNWWFSLPYVVAVFMGRGNDGEGPRGPFTLKTDNPYANDEGDDVSCLVAFEDRGDANNFCFILESFFEDLGDFSADIVPLSTKELEEEVKSHSKKVLVIKKGQLKLYAGQPLVDVEMALRSLVS